MGASLAVGFAAALAGGIVQGVTGFGAGVVMMLALPLAFAVPQAAGISGAVCMVLTAAMTWRYRARASVSAIVGPAVIYVVASSVSIVVARGVEQDAMKGALGVFLVLLACYFLFVQGEGEFVPKGAVALACIVVSGVCDGMFGIGGPLMVVYYLARTQGVEEYLGTIQGFFFVTLVCATAFRLASGVLGIGHVPMMLAGVAGVLAGSAIAARLVDRLDAGLVRRATYMVIGLAGVVNVAEALL